jgi:RNA polymerase sigma-70 factor, ECF subfamily
MPPDPFLACRARLRGVAYGILGDLVEAEDVVQDAWLRWREADREAVRSAEAFLVATTTRLAIDRLRSARARRETYVGTWLPTPLVVAGDDDPEGAAIEAEELDLALLCALERLDPVERAVLVLRDAFDLDYADVADALEVSPANARQIARRARERVGDPGRRRPVDRDRHRLVAAAFLRAANDGDVEAMVEVLAADAIQYSDGGGRVVAARKPIHGARRIAGFYARVKGAGNFPLDLEATPVGVNGAPGVRLVSRAGGLYAITAVEVVEDRVQAIRNFMNPDRLVALEALRPAPGGER